MKRKLKPTTDRLNKISLVVSQFAIDLSQVAKKDKSHNGESNFNTSAKIMNIAYRLNELAKCIR